MASEQDRKNVIDRIQREELAQLTKDLVDIPSPDRVGEGNRRIYLKLVFATRDQGAASGNQC